MFLGKPAEQFLTISNCIQSFKHDILRHDIWFLKTFTSFLKLFNTECGFVVFVVFISLKQSNNFKFSVCLLISQSVSLSVCLSAYLSVCLSVSLSDCLSAYLSVCQSVRAALCLPIYLAICLFVYCTWWFKA